MELTKAFCAELDRADAALMAHMQPVLDALETAEAEREQALDHLREVRNQLVKILKGLPL
jgi:hypothetical protein